MNRRQYLGIAGSVGIGSVAGCSLLKTEQRSVRAPPVLDNRPDAVYIPTHKEGMKMSGMGKSGRYRFALSYSFPHRFWLVNSDRTNRVEIKDEDTVHLMVSAWDSETKTAIPSSTAKISVSKGGETVTEKSLWPMLSQNMGFHYGDNVALDGDGDYSVDVQFGPVQTTTTGDFQEAFSTQANPSFTLEFEESKLQNVMFKRLDQRAGEKDAVKPMQMEMMPVPQLPTAEELLGTLIGTGTSGDGKFVTTVLDSPPTGIAESGQYIAVSPRTPYNRYPLPFMSLSATLSRDGNQIHSGQLTETLDPDLKYHFGTTVENVEVGDTLTLTPQTPPQVARHEGYEMAFLNMSPIELSIDSLGQSDS